MSEFIETTKQETFETNPNIPQQQVMLYNHVIRLTFMKKNRLISSCSVIIRLLFCKKNKRK